MEISISGKDSLYIEMGPRGSWDHLIFFYVNVIADILWFWLLVVDHGTLLTLSFGLCFQGYQGMVDGGDCIEEAQWKSVSNIMQKVSSDNGGAGDSWPFIQ